VDGRLEDVFILKFFDPAPAASNRIRSEFFLL